MGDMGYKDQEKTEMPCRVERNFPGGRGSWRMYVRIRRKMEMSYRKDREGFWDFRRIEELEREKRGYRRKQLGERYPDRQVGMDVR